MHRKCELSQGAAHVLGNGIDINFVFTQRRNGVWIDIEVNKDITSLSPKGFPYHIHEAPVSGDCMSTKMHLDNFNRNPGGPDSPYRCDSKAPELCEQGDLSGKNSVLSGTVGKFHYVETNLPRVHSLIGTTSVVVHLPDSSRTRLACATITKKF